MTLTDLQVELRSIENRISLLHSEIEKMKPQTEEQKKTDFNKITNLAKQHPIGNKTIREMSIEDKKLFINSLAYLTLADESDVYSRLLYLCRLAIGCELDVTAEEIYKNGLEFEVNDIDKVCTDLKEYKQTYFVEAFIMANISETASVNMISFIADIAKLLDDLDILLLLPSLSKNRWSNYFEEYITEEWIIEQRKEHGLLQVDKYVNPAIPFLRSGRLEYGYDIQHPCIVKERVACGQIVKKGDVIVTYEEKSINDNFPSIRKNALGVPKQDETRSAIREIKALCDGVVFFEDDYKEVAYTEKKDKYLAVYVVSYFDDYSDFRKWYSRNKC